MTRNLLALILFAGATAANAGPEFNVFGAIHESNCEGGCDRFDVNEADAGVAVRLGIGDHLNAELGVIDHHLTGGLFFAQPVGPVELEIGGGFLHHEATRRAFDGFPADRDRESYMPYYALGASVPVSGNISAFARWMRTAGDHSFSSTKDLGGGVTETHSETADFDDDIGLIGVRLSF